jgi:glutamine amidotransferase/cyclase
VIASSGAGKVEHFSEVFEKTDVEAALAAGLFHREEVPIEAVKEHMRDEGIETRFILKVSVHIEKGPFR